MILKRGDWIGKGSILVDGATLGVGLELALKIVDDDDGFTITGDVSGGGQGPISIRIAPRSTPKPNLAHSQVLRYRPMLL